MASFVQAASAARQSCNKCSSTQAAATTATTSKLVSQQERAPNPKEPTSDGQLTGQLPIVVDGNCRQLPLLGDDDTKLIP
jgi:hypothetical protein